jgi:XTP/dITP diphosphohydrolase
LKLLLATHNEHKRREFARLFERPGAERVEIDALPDTVSLPPEDGETFTENALGKGRAAAQATGRVSIADDSGIAAAALGGAPGVRSARYAGEHATDEENLQKLLREAPAGSALEYVCVIAYVDPASGVERVFEGRCGGRLVAEPRGEGGFGYDPAFVPDDGPPVEDGETPLTMAELSDAQKDAISHRGRAARALLEWLAGNPAHAI